MSLARRELHNLLNQDVLKNCILLVFANKQDLPGHLTEEQVGTQLELDSLPGDRQWKLQPAIAKDNTGLREGLTWLSTELRPAGCNIL